MLHRRRADWALVNGAASESESLLNASYAISVARKLGCTIFLLPEDIIEVRTACMFVNLAQLCNDIDCVNSIRQTNPKLVLTFLASIMAVATGIDKH